MKFDRNTILGFVVLGLLLVGYLWTTSKEQANYRKQKAIQDSLELAKKPKVQVDTATLKRDSLYSDSMNRVASQGTFRDTTSGPEQLITRENELLKITFSTKGGQPKKVELKKFKGIDSTPVKLSSTSFDKIDYPINTSGKTTAYISEINFKLDTVVENPDHSQTISFVKLATDGSGELVKHRFTIRPNDYMIDFDVQFEGADKLLTQGNMNMIWQYNAVQQESGISFEQQNTQIGYVMDGEYDYHTIGRRNSKEFKYPVHWLGVRQRFFNTILLAKNNFSSGKIEWTVPSDTSGIVAHSTANLTVKLPVQRSATASFSILYGPADYHMLVDYNQKFGKLINLGQGPYAFVRPLNKYVVMPIFSFVKGFSGGSLGLAIALLTIIIRLLISPLTYTSYLSGAKMKVLRPEIAKLREKFGKDQQAMSMEQMKLFREAGVNPLGGCIPALLQIPIFFALFSFFSSAVDLRGHSFLWAPDLSAPDEVIKFGMHIPLLGSHLSLFTITAVATSFLISIYSMSMSPDQSNPIMKYMPYIFPVFLLFIFNSLPSALTWYYTVSNIITLALQFIIQNYIIDHDKILAKMEENRKKPKAKSKWQERMEQMQQQQKKAKDQQRSKR